MREKTQVRLCGAVMAAIGIPTLYVAQWGALWQPGLIGQLGWWERDVLRPGMYGIGVAACLGALWYTWIVWTRFGRVLLSWREACAWERLMDEQCKGYADFQPRTLAADLHHLWYLLTHCAIGRHDVNSFSYSNGGEDGPRGTQCCDCGLYMSREDITRPHVPLSQEDIARMEAEMATYMTEEVAGDSDTIMVLYPDGQRRPEDAPTRH